MADIEGIKPETLELEWAAEYKDGTRLKQNYGVGEENGEHHFGHIDQAKLKAFWLESKGDVVKAIGVDVQDQQIIIDNVRFKVDFPRDKEGNVVLGKLVYFRRVRSDFHPEGIKIGVRYAIGLQATIDGVNKQQYVFINSDGTYTLSQQK